VRLDKVNLVSVRLKSRRGEVCIVREHSHNVNWCYGSTYDIQLEREIQVWLPWVTLGVVIPIGINPPLEPSCHIQF